MSPQLQASFNLLEICLFRYWQKASSEEREKICVDLGKWEAEKIIEEIVKEAEEKNKNNNHEFE